MREIKFRGYDKESQKIYQITDINFRDYVANGVVCYGDWKEFSINNLLQYTGLKDKNGVEIYEGDILKVLVAYTDYDGCEYKRPSSSYNHKTKYVNIAVSIESGTFILDTDYTDSLDRTLWLWTQEDVEVIGNIYENKELLNTKG